MKRILLSLLFAVCVGHFTLFGQGKLEVSIVATATDLDSIFIENEEGIIIDTVLISLSTDDAEQENDEIDALFDDDLDAGWEGQEGDENILTMGLRFQNITIPKNATIDSAFIYVYSHEEKMADDVAKITIYGEASDNAITFDEDNLITARPKTAAKAIWTVAEEWFLWKQYRTTDLKSIVQEVVNLGGWSSGNAMAFILDGENQGPSDVENAREMESFENISDPGDEDADGNKGDGKNHPERAPKLVIYYGNPSSAVSDLKQTNQLFDVYPSVVTNGFVKIHTINTLSSALVSITDITGKTVFSQFASEIEDGMTLNIDNLSGGVYFLTIQNSKVRGIKKIIIK